MILHKNSRAYNTEILKENNYDSELDDKITRAVYYDLYTYILSETLLSRISQILYRVLLYENNK